jgi:hypothetical protein
MINILLLILAVATTTNNNFYLLNHFPDSFRVTEQPDSRGKQTVLGINLGHPASLPIPLSDISSLLYAATDAPSASVIDKVMTTINCARQYKVPHNNILTVIDYSLPSNVKRLWVFDLKEKKLLFHTYVSHGIKSGTLLTTFFSNKFDSKASSMGVYKTEKAYYGREGLSLRLDGLDVSFNDNASNRSVVMHGGWYVEEPFIKKYGRPGRSWGCPAIPPVVSRTLINTIKENSLFVIYYPSDHWFSKSRFLHCNNIQTIADNVSSTSPVVAVEVRDDVLFAPRHNSHQWSENTPVLVISADNYEQLFHAKVPLGRMLRRQINAVEYIALSPAELGMLVMQTHEGVYPQVKEVLNKISFVVPQIIMVRGYYETQMKVVHLGIIKEVRLDGAFAQNPGKEKKYTVYFESREPMTVEPTSQFIRWVGL